MAPLLCCPVQRFGFFLLLVFMQDRNVILVASFELSATVGMLRWPCEHMLLGEETFILTTVVGVVRVSECFA